MIGNINSKHFQAAEKDLDVHDASFPPLDISRISSNPPLPWLAAHLIENAWLVSTVYPLLQVVDTQDMWVDHSALGEELAFPYLESEWCQGNGPSLDAATEASLAALDLLK